MLVEIIMYKTKKVEMVRLHRHDPKENFEFTEKQECVWKHEIKECERICFYYDRISFNDSIDDIKYDVYREYLSKIEVFVNGVQKLNRIFEIIEKKV